MTKEELKEKWNKEVRIYGFTEPDDSIAKKLKGEIADWWLNQFDLYKKELVEKAEGMKKECPNCFPDNADDERVECYGYHEMCNQALDEVLSIVNEK